MNTPLVTTLSSKTKTVKISQNSPFVIIGERINPTNRKKLAAALLALETHAANPDHPEFKEGYAYVQGEAVKQVEAGAHVLDVNVGFAGGDEAVVMPIAVKAILEVVDVPLSFDSPNATAVEAGLRTFNDITGGKGLINSTTAEVERAERMLPIAKKFGAALVALAHGESGIPNNVEERFAAAQTILRQCSDFGIPPEDILLDPLTLTVGADDQAGKVCLATLRRVTLELGLNTTNGASNVAFGLPDRKAINLTYLPMLIANGLTSAITNPMEAEIVTASKAADMLSGRDRSCLNWIKHNRAKAKAQAEAEAKAQAEALAKAA
jgi:5-methyltetrahydrofolate--homocysteine methyltransferase